MTLPPKGPVLTHSIGRVDHPPTYFEVLTPAAGSNKPPVVMIHGGAHTGACYLATPDGRAGWAHLFAAAGYQVIVPDWPGLGRSGYVDLSGASGEVVAAGLGKVLTTFGRPAIVLTHSMSGAYGWKLLERNGEHIAKLVAVAPAPPGNIQKPAEIVAETAEFVTIRLEGTTMTLARHAQQLVDRGFVEHTLIGDSALFPRDLIASYSAALNPIPARLLLERRNVGGGQLRVDDFSKFRDKPVLLLTGAEDRGHARSVDEPIADWLNAHGAKADFIYLPDLGIYGNGHMLMLERNSDAIAHLIINWIESRAKA
jgi:pimeloyl-ACP methyl ester carboxylesterase